MDMKQFSIENSSNEQPHSGDAVDCALINRALIHFDDILIRQPGNAVVNVTSPALEHVGIRFPYLALHNLNGVPVLSKEWLVDVGASAAATVLLYASLQRLTMFAGERIRVPPSNRLAAIAGPALYESLKTPNHNETGFANSLSTAAMLGTFDLSNSILAKVGMPGFYRSLVSGIAGGLIHQSAHDYLNHGHFPTNDELKAAAATGVLVNFVLPMLCHRNTPCEQLGSAKVPKKTLRKQIELANKKSGEQTLDPSNELIAVEPVQLVQRLPRSAVEDPAECQVNYHDYSSYLESNGLSYFTNYKRYLVNGKCQLLIPEGFQLIDSTLLAAAEIAGELARLPAPLIKKVVVSEYPHLDEPWLRHHNVDKSLRINAECADHQTVMLYRPRSADELRIDLAHEFGHILKLKNPVHSSAFDRLMETDQLVLFEQNRHPIVSHDEAWAHLAEKLIGRPLPEAILVAEMNLKASQIIADTLRPSILNNDCPTREIARYRTLLGYIDKRIKSL